VAWRIADELPAKANGAGYPIVIHFWLHKVVTVCTVTDSLLKRRLAKWLYRFFTERTDAFCRPKPPEVKGD
jgi:hypothetical protein